MAIQIADDSRFQVIIQSNEKVIVKFYADWCGSCKLFAPKYKKMSENEKFKDLLFLDVNAEENPEARKSAGVTNLPFFAVYKNGQLVEGVATSSENYVIKMAESIL